ncbi:class II glutamine amidotransferase [Mycobacterium camsae]|uniref:class II glutamine amidotransferase n=1 Tax=Mycobacterium gordonae TaxID=1778 RepID=UPI001980A75D|nr:class II glutamine amidotransferase [Mycobacterium gordonae]
MCRLFGLHAGTEVVTATFWLLEAPDSLARQSRKNPDGTGLGVFDEHGRPQLHKEPVAAWQDATFATEAHRLDGTTFIAHVRYATTGSLDVRNTHPFLQDGRIFAHNGMIEGLETVDERLRELGADHLVLGQTDSERIFALITAGIRAHGGDVSAGVVEAVSWLADKVPVYAVNLLLCMGTKMWALRYPDTHQLFMLDRRVDGVPDFDMSTSRIHAQCQTLTERSSVVFATEPMDDDPRWCLLDPGELVYVDAALDISRTMVLPDPPRQLVRRDDLSQPVFRAQHALPGTRHRP